MRIDTLQRVLFIFGFAPVSFDGQQGTLEAFFFVYAPVFGSDEGAFGSCSAAVRRRRQQRQRHWCCRVLVSVLPSFPRTNKRRSRLPLSEVPSLRIGAADARVTSSDRLTKL